MRHRFWTHCSLALALALTTRAAAADPVAGLGPANFVDVGDGVTAMLSTSGLAFSTLLVGAATLASPRLQQASLSHTRSRLGNEAIDSPCPDGGQVSARLYDADGSADLSVEDRVTTLFEACSVDGQVVTGRSEFRVISHRFEGPVEITELAFRFDKLGTATLHWNGTAGVVMRTDSSLGSERYVVSYRDLLVVQGQRHMRWNFQLDLLLNPFGGQAVSVDGVLQIDGLSLQLRQSEPYAVHRDGYPRSGRLMASDEQGARLEVEAGRWRYRYRLFGPENQGETADSTSQSKPYREP